MQSREAVCFTAIALGLLPGAPKRLPAGDGLMGHGWEVHLLSTLPSLNNDELMKMKMRSSTAAEKRKVVGRVEAKLPE